jgi:hypothetical protein
MAIDVVSATPDTTVRQAANLVRGRTIGCLLVIEHDSVVGLVTTTDLLDQLGRGAVRPDVSIEPPPLRRPRGRPGGAARAHRAEARPPREGAGRARRTPRGAAARGQARSGAHAGGAVCAHPGHRRHARASGSGRHRPEAPKVD